MKTFLIALGLVLVLFIYGYVASTVGHDHSKHSGEGHHVSEHSHGEHDHSHH